MRIAAVILAVLAAAGCMGPTVGGGGGSTKLSSPTMLEISVSVRGAEAPTKVWRLRCPAGVGSLPHPDRACQKLQHLRRPFAPVPKATACTQIYGGPQIADVRGVFRGRPVNAHFDKGNGCEIARWNRVRFLFPYS